ncbi:hypothetical protein D083_0786 [Dickeya solani RNS 08.23.3.1.A]|nr:hypothetical protein D083_0786 [Dickeya solani RNS 08.23.3.1.A]
MFLFESKYYISVLFLDFLMINNELKSAFFVLFLLILNVILNTGASAGFRTYP